MLQQQSHELVQTIMVLTIMVHMKMLVYCSNKLI